MRGGERLRPAATATTLRVNGGGRLLSDGPFAETKEQAEVRATIERVFRAEHGKVIAALIGALGDFERAEEAVQDAFTVALSLPEGLSLSRRAILVCARDCHPELAKDPLLAASV